MPSIFTCGDSYMKDGDVRTWPRQVAVAITAEEHNFAVAGTTSDALVPQFDKGFDCNAHIDVAMVGGGLGDLLEDFETFMKNTDKAIFSQVRENKREVMSRLYSKGVKHFVVTSGPFTTSLPHIRERIEEYADNKGCTIEAAEAFATQGQETLSHMISDMVQKFLQEYPDTKIIFFQEFKKIEKWSAEDGLFDTLGLHPNENGHTELADVVLDLLRENGFPMASEAASESQIADAPTTPQVAPAPAGSAETLPNPIQADANPWNEWLLPFDASLDDKFAAASEAVKVLVKAGVVSVSQGLIFYKLYKQGTEGDNTRPKPSMFEHFGQTKKFWSAWNELKGKTQDWAKQEYVNAYLGFISKRRRT